MSNESTIIITTNHIKTSTSNNTKSYRLPKDIIATKITNFIKRGRIEVTTKKELEKFPAGSLISYITKNGIYKNGGFITKFGDNYFIYVTLDSDLNLSTKYRAYYDNISKMWAGDVYKVTDDIVSMAQCSKKKTNFPVIIGNVVVYYGIGTFDMIRFTHTDKYKILISWYKYFVDPNFDPE